MSELYPMLIVYLYITELGNKLFLPARRVHSETERRKRLCSAAGDLTLRNGSAYNITSTPPQHTRAVQMLHTTHRRHQHARSYLTSTHDHAVASARPWHDTYAIPLLIPDPTPRGNYSRRISPPWTEFHHGDRVSPVSPPVSRITGF